MHTSKLQSLAVGISMLAVSPVFSATFSFGGNGLSTLSTRGGANLPDDSIIQVGYFLGVESSKSPADYSLDDWSSFTPIAGLGSLNSRLDLRTRSGGAFTSVYALGNVTLDDTMGDTLPALPSRFGVRVFDTTDPLGIGTADYNIVSAPLDRWFSSGVVTDPPAPDPNFGYAQGGTGANPSLVWQGAPFATSITTVVPEPSSLLSALVGFGLLASRRRRA